MKIAYLGPKGTFTEQAVKELFPDSELIAIRPIRNVVNLIESGKAEFGVLPLENFYNGEVRETLDALTESKDVKIIQEKALTISHCIGFLKNHEQIKKVISKDQALEQCSKYLCDNYPDADTIAVTSTTEAAKRIIKENLLDAAAIGSESSLRELGLEILDKDICKNNKTRFVVIGKKETQPSGDDKTFLAINPKIDRPGVLYNILGFLAGLQINLEYIQSRPNGEKGYYFYLELDGHLQEENVEKAIEAIKLSLDPEKKFANTVKILGSFPNTHWK